MVSDWDIEHTLETLEDTTSDGNQTEETTASLVLPSMLELVLPWTNGSAPSDNAGKCDSVDSIVVHASKDPSWTVAGLHALLLKLHVLVFPP